MNATKIIGDVGQWTAAFLCAIGAYLITRRSGFNGSAYVVVGSLFFAVFTKIKYYRRHK